MVNTLFGLSLVVISAVLLWWHTNNWQVAKSRIEKDSERLYTWRQFRRRVQASSMLGVVGIAVVLGQYIPISPTALIYWFIVVLVVLWIILLALADLVSTRLYLEEIRRDTIVEQALLREEMRQLRPSPPHSLYEHRDP